MKFPVLSDGDRVVLERTDCRRGYFDMGPNPIAVVTVSNVTEKSFVAAGKRYARSSGVAIGPPGCTRLSASPYVEGVEEEIAARKAGKPWKPAETGPTQ